jgi:hypothetical protein
VCDDENEWMVVVERGFFCWFIEVILRGFDGFEKNFGFQFG